LKPEAFRFRFFLWIFKKLLLKLDSVPEHYELNQHLNEGFSSRFDPFCDNFLNTKYDIPNFQKKQITSL
jgi:hypothetical protein